MAAPRNILLITLDQFRGDSLSCAGHPLVRTPHLDALAASGVRLARHYSQATPCAPGRAALYTGMYQMNNRVVANGSPLDARFDNVALAGRRAGYEPALFGYTDQAVDPREVTDPDDPRLQTYEGVLPGFDAVLDLTQGYEPFLSWLEERGHDISPGLGRLLSTEHQRPESDSVSAFVTDAAVDWLRRQDRPWFAHLSYLRPHPPYSAAGKWGSMYDPAGVDMPIAPADERHPFHDLVLRHPDAAAPLDEGKIRWIRSQYYGMITEVDSQLGRVWDTLREIGAWDDTLIVVTADHGEQLGDHGLIQKLGYWESSYHILGIVRDPSSPSAWGTVVDRFTENVDLMPTICDAIGVGVPLQSDGVPLTPFLRGEEPPWWRDAAHWEYDSREFVLRAGVGSWPWDRRPERRHLAVLRTEAAAYVQFGDGSWLCFDLAADPTWRTAVTDSAVVLPLAQAMLVWRSTHTDRTLADVLVGEGGGAGRSLRPAG
jgi:arylsulfatase A-like enzyme